MVDEWRGFHKRVWNSEKPLVFFHVIFKKTLSACEAKDIQKSISRRMELWYAGRNKDLIGGTEAKGVVWE